MALTLALNNPATTSKHMQAPASASIARVRIVFFLVACAPAE
jgi:hypothetical protein